jgi:hypothetical protein
MGMALGWGGYWNMGHILKLQLGTLVRTLVIYPTFDFVKTHNAKLIPSTYNPNA